jgi:hypothetical protein
MAVSTGSLVGDKGEYGRMRFGTCMQALGTMGYVAVSPSPFEMAWLTPGSNDSPLVARPEVVCANLLDVEGAPIARDWVQVRAGHAEVAVTGVICEGQSGPAEGNRGARIAPPLESLKRLSLSLGGCDGAVVIVNGTMAQADSLAPAAPEGSILLASHGGEQEAKADSTGKRLLVGAPRKGRYLGFALVVDVGGSRRWEVSWLPIEEDLPEDERIVALREAHLLEMRGTRLVEAYSGRSRAGRPGDVVEGGRYAGSGACAPCHEEATLAWERSAHSRAIETLRTSGHDADPGCIECHVVGYKEAGGFLGEDETPELGEVGCEACHGPRLSHVKSPGSEGTGRGKPGGVGNRNCRECHTPEHSPGFDMEAAWGKVRHGAK